MWWEIVGCERRTRSSMSPAQRHGPLVAFCAFASASPSFRACRILRRVGSAMACNARSREDSFDDMDPLLIRLICRQFSSVGNYLARSGVNHLRRYAVGRPPRHYALISKQGSRSFARMGFRMNAFDLVGTSAPRPFPKWLPHVGGLLAAAFVASFVSHLPLVHTLSPGEIPRFRECPRSVSSERGGGMGPVHDPATPVRSRYAPPDPANLARRALARSPRSFHPRRFPLGDADGSRVCNQGREIVPIASR